jgi:signal transduction histidine kinase
LQPSTDPSRLVRAFQEVGLHLSRDLDILHVLEIIVEWSRELTGARYGAAATLGPKGIDAFVYRGLTDEEVARLPHIPQGKGLLKAVIDERQPVRLKRLSDDPRSEGFPDQHVAMDAFLGIPMQHRGDLVGALYLTKQPGQPAFTQEDEEIMLALGSMAAVGIQNARLFARESERAARSALLRDISWDVRHSLDVVEVLTVTVETLGRAAGVDRCFIRSVENPGGDLLGPIEYEWTAPGIEPVAGRKDVQFPISGLAARTMRTQWSSDFGRDSRVGSASLPEASKKSREAGALAVLACPLEWGGELLGVVAFQSLLPREWSDADIRLIQEAAQEVSGALHHARLYSVALDTADRLKELNDLRSDFVAMVSHELRSPMTVVSGIAHLLQWHKEKIQDEDRDQLLNTLERESRRLTRMVSEFLDLEAIDRGRIHLQTEMVDLVELGAEAIADSGHGPRTDLVADAVEAKAVIDRDRVKQVILNLVGNAAKFSAEPAPITVRVSADDDSVQVTVEDRGPGIPGEEIGRLFERFSRLSTAVGRSQGSGIGLYVSRMIVEMHGGQIWAESEAGTGSRFCFSLPR